MTGVQLALAIVSAFAGGFVIGGMAWAAFRSAAHARALILELEVSELRRTAELLADAVEDYVFTTDRDLGVDRMRSAWQEYAKAVQFPEDER